MTPGHSNGDVEKLGSLGPRASQRECGQLFARPLLATLSERSVIFLMRKIFWPVGQRDLLSGQRRTHVGQFSTRSTGRAGRIFSGTCGFWKLLSIPRARGNGRRQSGRD